MVSAGPKARRPLDLLTGGTGGPACYIRSVVPAFRQMRSRDGILGVLALLCSCGRIDYDVTPAADDASAQDAAIVDAVPLDFDASTFDAGPASSLSFVSLTQVGGTGSTATGRRSVSPRSMWP